MPAATDSDVERSECDYDVEEQHNKRAHRVVADHAPAVGRYRRTAAEAHSVVAMHPRDDGHRHRP